MTIRMPFEDPVGLTPWERMVESGSKALSRLFRHPNVAGWTWYRWVATNPLKSPRNCGLVDGDDECHPWNVEGLTLLNPHAERIRAEADATRWGPCDGAAGRLVITLQHACTTPGFDRAAMNKVVFGVVCEDGRVEPGLHGYGTEGDAKDAGSTDGCLAVRVDLRFTDEVFRRGTGKARYEITFDRRAGELLRGTYKGTHEGQDVSGEAYGWLEGGPLTDTEKRK